MERWASNVQHTRVFHLRLLRNVRQADFSFGASGISVACVEAVPFSMLPVGALTPMAADIRSLATAHRYE